MAEPRGWGAYLKPAPIVAVLWSTFQIYVVFTGFVEPLHSAAGVILVLMLLEACRRTVGYSLTIVGVCFVVYAFWGSYLPGLLGHRGLSLEGVIDLQAFSN